MKSSKFFLLIVILGLVFSCSTDNSNSIADVPDDTISDTETPNIMSNSIFEDGERYLGSCFTMYDSLMDVEYGEAITISGSFKTLKFNMYEPQADVESSRPLVIIAVGGGFFYTSRTLAQTVASSIAKCGYVVAVIDYRVYDKSDRPIDAESLEISAALAVDDMRSAISFFKREGATYEIDTSSIFIMGHSAGGIMSLYSAYAKESGDFPVNAHSVADTIHPFENVAGVVSISGAVSSRDMFKNSTIPLFMAHGDLDDTVPIDSGMSSVMFMTEPIYQYGSAAIVAITTPAGIPTNYFGISGEDHTSIVTTAGLKLYGKSMLAFFDRNRKK